MYTLYMYEYTFPCTAFVYSNTLFHVLPLYLRVRVSMHWRLCIRVRFSMYCLYIYYMSTLSHVLPLRTYIHTYTHTYMYIYTVAAAEAGLEFK